MALTNADLPKLVELLNLIDIRVQKRRRTAAEWVAGDEVLLSGEEGLETDTGLAKVGNGVDGWTDLPYKGANATTLAFVAETSTTTAADPGAGALKWAHATQSSAAHLYLNDATVDGVDLNTFLGEQGPTGFLHLVAAGDSAKWQVWKWTALADNTGWWTFDVEFQAGAGSFADGQPLRASFVAAGGANYAAGAGIAIDNTNPAAPVISSTVAAIALSGSPATYAALPGGLGSGDAGKAYLVTADNMIYAWSGSAFPAQGNGVSAGSKVRTALKTADESRASTTTRSADSDLQMYVTPGLYFVECFAYLDVAAGSNANHNVQIVGPIGSATYFGYRRRYKTVSTTGTDNETTQSGTLASGSTGITTTGTMPGAYYVDTALEVTAPGILTLVWAQNTSSATASIIQKGSFLRVTKL